MKTIITHPGQAHRDEFLAVSFLLALYQDVKQVFRRNPSELELADPKVVCVDVGMRHEPELSNFDHHQEKAMDCALILVLAYHQLLDSASKTFNWLGFTNTLDTRGPFVVSKELGISPDLLFGMLSPIEGQILSMFGQHEDVPSTLVDLMREIGKGLLTKIQFTQTRMSELVKTAKVVEVGGLTGILSTIEDRPSALLQEYRDKNAPQAAFSICPDDRGKGWIMYRFNDHPKLNFSLLEEKDGIEFAHKGGFIAKTSERIALDSVLAMVNQAIV